MKLRGSGFSIDAGINSFVLSAYLEAVVPLPLYSPSVDVDVTLGFEVSVQDAYIRGSAALERVIVVTNNSAQTKVSPGPVMNTLSVGWTTVVADACELVSDAYLSAVVGQVIAGHIGDALTLDANNRLSAMIPPPVPVKLYDIDPTEIGITYRYCPVHT
jgi:hypothetical protein